MRIYLHNDLVSALIFFSDVCIINQIFIKKQTNLSQFQTYWTRSRFQDNVLFQSHSIFNYLRQPFQYPSSEQHRHVCHVMCAFIVMSFLIYIMDATNCSSLAMFRELITRCLFFPTLLPKIIKKRKKRCISVSCLPYRTCHHCCYFYK